MKTIYYMSLFLCLIGCACTSQNNISIIKTESRVHRPPYGLTVTDFEEALILVDRDKHLLRKDKHFKKARFNGKDTVKSLIRLIKEDGMYLKLPEDWYLNTCFYESTLSHRRAYEDLDKEILDHLFPSHLVNPHYRVVLGRKDTVYMGEGEKGCLPDIILYNDTYYITKINFCNRFDSLARVYMGIPDTWNYVPD